MWQRVQTLYFVAVLAMFGCMLIIPLVNLNMGNETFVLNYQGIVSVGDKPELVQQTVMLTILEAVIAIIAGISIFLFKKRMIQIRFTIFNLVLMVGYYVLLALYLYVASKSGMDFHLRLPVVFPIIGIILSYLAIRAIGKDEALIRSLNRIR
jgi:hypothetical protein